MRDAGCLVCGAELKYESHSRPMRCYLCGQEYDSNAACENGHYVCDACHRLPANEFIASFCIAGLSKDPIEQSIALMHDKRIKMHGPEHHFLVPAVLLSAYYNVTGATAEKAEKIGIAKIRTADIPGGFCGFQGACGAAIGTGVFISVLTGATPLSTTDWRLGNLQTSRSLAAIAEKGGPRCCKRDTFLAIQEAVKFVQENFGVVIPVTKDIKCDFSSVNKQCLKDKCLFYKRD